MIVDLERELVYIGKLRATKGIKGELRIMEEDEFHKLGDQKVVVYTGSNSVYEIEKLNIDSIKLKGIDSIEEAEKLVNRDCYIFKRDLDILKAPLIEYLIGLDVYKDGEFIGQVEDIAYTSSHKMVVVNGIMYSFNESMVSDRGIEL